MVLGPMALAGKAVKAFLQSTITIGQQPSTRAATSLCLQTFNTKFRAPSIPSLDSADLEGLGHSAYLRCGRYAVGGFGDGHPDVGAVARLAAKFELTGDFLGLLVRQRNRPVEGYQG